MEIVDPLITGYAGEFTADEPSVLAALNRETNANVLMPRMLSGHLQGRVLSMISHMIKPENVLEIGTFTGYSAICFAEGLSDNGIVHTIDINDELEPLVKSYIKKSGMENRIINYYGNAKDIIPSMNIEFDLVFIDADKINYSLYYDLVFDKVKPNGYIVADNVLWDGKILDLKTADKDTLAIHQFNQKIKNDVRVENVMLTVRDGLMVIRKK